MPQTASAHPRQPRTRQTLFAAVAMAAAASVCCVGPLVLIGLGATGAWMTHLTILEPIRPLLTLATGGLLGYAFARVYATSATPQSCEPGSVCADPRAGRINKLALWSVTVVVTGLLLTPSFVRLMDSSSLSPAGSLASEGPSHQSQAVDQTVQRATLSLQNMTCDGCAHNVRTALAKLDGVTVLEVTFEPPRAIVEFDSGKVAAANLITATTEVGYPSRLSPP